MFSKVLIASLLIVAASARPDDFDDSLEFGYNYRGPQRTYSAPRPVYSPPRSSYVAPQPSYVPPQQSYSAPQPTYTIQEESKEEEDVPLMPFNYGYKVKDDKFGTDFSHSADSDGQVVNGEYRVALPDGRTQIVKYYVTKKDGYVAKVTYEGEARPYVPPPKESDEDSHERPSSSYSVPQTLYQANF